MSTINKDRDMIISKNIDISNCNWHDDIENATDWTYKWIESDEFQSGNTKLELRVTTNWRNYDIGLYRDGDAIHVWIDGNFAYEISLSSGGLKSWTRHLFQNWRGVPGIEMIYRGDWCDPQLFRNGIKANYREVEDYLYEDFIDGLKGSNKYDKFIKLKSSQQNKQFDDWLFDHYYRIVEIFLGLRDCYDGKTND